MLTIISTKHLIEDLSTKFDLVGEGPINKKDLCLTGAVYRHGGLVLVDISIDIAVDCRSTF